MKAILKISPLDKDRFKEVLNLSNEMKITDITIISEGDNYFEIEYEKEIHIFNLGRAYQPYKMPTKMGSITINQDNFYLSTIKY
jgi:hypothetical protein